MTLEFNFDGLVGPTHNYSGLAYGNVASMKSAGSVSNPKQAAKQGLAKMKTLMELGVPQAVLPPHQRPNISLLHELGFKNIEQAHKYNPAIVAAIYSAASMWAANTATVSPSCNNRDGKLHITPANLTYSLHRAQEASFSYKLLQKIFSDSNLFAVHPPLPAYNDLADEGAANHSNFCLDYDKSGLEMYVFGRTKDYKKFMGRQTRLASNALACTRLLKNQHLLVQQNPKVIDAGVFHNDVICVVNKNLIFYHQEAFVNWAPNKEKIIEFFEGDCHFIEVSASQLSVQKAVETYVFNSQIVSLDDRTMALIAPMECNTSSTSPLLDEIAGGKNPINTIKYVECRESMRNGGGPACLRLRVVLDEQQQLSCHRGVIMTEELYNKLDTWIDKHYRDRLEPSDLLDPNLIEEIYIALDELTTTLSLGSIYPFQCN